MLHSSHKHYQVAAKASSFLGGAARHLHSSEGSHPYPSLTLGCHGLTFPLHDGDENRARHLLFLLYSPLTVHISHRLWRCGDDEPEWRAYLSWLGFNEVSAPPPLIGNYLVHQEFWQLSKSHSPGPYLVANLKFFLRWNWRLHHTFLLNLQYGRRNDVDWIHLYSALKNCTAAYGIYRKLSIHSCTLPSKCRVQCI